MISRRRFIRTTALSVASTVLFPHFLKAAPAKTNIGLQLYTVRDAMKQDLKGTLRKIKKIGYTWLEAAGYGDGKFYGVAPAEFRLMVEGMGMEIVSSHATFTADKQKEALAAHVELGVKYLVYPIFPIPDHKTKEDFIQAAARLNAIGAACNKAGIRFGYHNHDFEFVDFGDSKGYDVLMKYTEPSMVCFEPDFYWMVYAGVDPLEYFGKYPGRFEVWHIKDMKDDPGKGFAEVGEGIIPFDGIFNESELAGMKYFFVEQDTSDQDPLVSAEISFNNLRNLLKK